MEKKLFNKRDENKTFQKIIMKKIKNETDF